MARLLAAERPAALAQHLEDVAVADRRRRDLEPGLAHRGVEAVVRHDRDGDAVAGQTARSAQVEGRERDQLVTVDDDPVTVDREHAVPVAVEGEARVVTARDDGLRQRLDVGRPDAVVDVAPVGLGSDRRDARAETAEDLRADPVGRSVGAVEQDVEPAEIERREALVERAQVVLLRAVQRADPSDPRRRRRIPRRAAPRSPPRRRRRA